MTSSNFLRFAAGTAILALLSIGVRAAVPLPAETWAFHGAHFALALAVAVLLEWGVRRLRGIPSALWVRGNPLLRWFFVNLAIWAAIVAVVLVTGLPRVRGGTSLIVYWAVLYLAASALVGVFRTITTGRGE